MISEDIFEHIKECITEMNEAEISFCAKRINVNDETWKILIRNENFEHYTIVLKRR
jgi:Asp-tRNA(Asn)/Glu-tRNA(Gln) amidotransferase B subunit